MPEKTASFFTKYKFVLIGLVVIAALVLAFLMLYNPKITVPGKHRTIQQAIEAASDGDVIVVDPGVYYEQIDFMGKDITVKSSDPDDPEVVAETIIDGRKRGSVVTFNSGESQKAVLEGFTITGGVGTLAAAPLTEEGEEAVEGYYGGGIYITAGSSPTLRNNVIRDNSVDLDGGGIAVREDSNPVITGNQFSGNSAMGGGAIAIFASSPLVEDNFFENNKAGYLGGAILVDTDAFPAINNNEITENSSTSGGGIAVWHSEPKISANNIHSNTAIWYGGGLALFQASPNIQNNSILRNSATNNGGGLAVADGSSPVITGNIISRNYTEENGGGIAVLEGSSVLIADSDLSENAVLYGGGGLYISESSVEVSGTNFSNNLVQQDGGGIALLSGSKLVISNSVIDDNVAGRAGGGMVVGDGAVLTMEDCTVAGNKSVYGGGIIAQTSTLMIERTIFSENLAEAGSGGGIYLMVSSAGEFSHCDFIYNRATEFGGAIVVYDDSTAKLRSNDFTANEAGMGGAYIGFGQASIDVAEPDDNSYKDNVPEDVAPSAEDEDENKKEDENEEEAAAEE